MIVNFLKKKHYLNPKLQYRKAMVPIEPARRIKEIFWLKGSETLGLLFATKLNLN